MPRKFMITGALPYSNGRLHVVGAVLEPIPVSAFALILQQRSRQIGWLGIEDVQSRAGNEVLLQRLPEGIVIDEPSPGRIDQQGGSFHRPEFPGPH